MTPASVLDPEGAHLAALLRLGDFRGKRIIELGCGDGRLTVGVAREASAVPAFDPDAEAVERARRALPEELARRVAYRVASGLELEVEPHSFDLALFAGRSDESSPRTSWTSWAAWSRQSRREVSSSISR